MRADKQNSDGVISMDEGEMQSDAELFAGLTSDQRGVIRALIGIMISLQGFPDCED